MVSVVPCKARHVGRLCDHGSFGVRCNTREKTQDACFMKGVLHGLGYERTCQART